MYNDSYLSHYGIKGQKWGIRRYQNSDGSLTEAGRVRYGNALYKDMNRMSKNMSPYDTVAATNVSLDSNKAIKNFEENNETRKKLAKVNSEMSDIGQKANSEINAKLTKKYGNFLTLSDSDKGRYLSEGLDLMKKRLSKDDYQKFSKVKIELSQQYEKEARAFLKELLKDRADTPVNPGWAISYNYKTKEFSKQTITDLAGIEMLKRAGGLI